uniref:Inositol oxygenase n=1 Tax=Pseudo-nitzschia delicatissima TaxID=44447 RepID=A0A7S0TB77_9STRA|mmetsp:Transcript_1559/g.3621  ORF Transcript_1559/g.3621 Transcript_1559/m.3621 type:complete len:707 (+) Transcript_1559:290-2410(+)
MSPCIESSPKKRSSISEQRTHHPGIRKRPRYLTSWEESFRRLPNLRTDETESPTLGNRFGLVDLFGRNRWANEPLTTSTSSRASNFFTLRIEHRTGGALAKHAGEERVLLFRSDQAGAIAKIIFSSSPVGDDDTEKRHIATAANAKVHVLFVKDAYRGFNLGGLLFILCTTYLRERYHDTICSGFRDRSLTETVSIRCQLDAEEDIRRHDKLIHFYEHLGLRKRKRAKATFINNNDGETYRRIPMKMDLLVSSCQANKWQRCCPESGVAEGYSSFLPALMLSAMGNLANVDNQCIDSWLIVECQDGTIELRTTDGRLLQQDCQGRCNLLPIHSQSSSCNFQLLRVSDKLDKVLWNRDEEYSTTTRQQQDQNFGKEKELWMLRSPSHGTFLGLTSDNNLITSSEASFWQVDENFCLTHTSDSPARRQHYRRMWKTQSIAYVEKMREKHLTFALGSMTIEKALDHTQHLLANPFSMSGAEVSCSDIRPPSVRTLLFHTAELARKEGHPDWVQFIALVHGLASILTCLRSNSSDTSNMAGKDDGNSDFDWTIPVDARVMGCKASENSIFQEFRTLNPDQDDPRYNTANGLYQEHIGLENFILSWTSNEYMYHMLKHNNVRLPTEAFAILRLVPLVDWHKWGNHESLSNEDDEEVKPFVADVYELFERSRDTVTSSRSSKETSERECRELWTNHYSLIANKYGAGGILEW